MVLCKNKVNYVIKLRCLYYKNRFENDIFKIMLVLICLFINVYIDLFCVGVAFGVKEIIGKK